MNFSGQSLLLLVRHGKTVLLFQNINRIEARSFQAVPFFKHLIILFFCNYRLCNTNKSANKSLYLQIIPITTLQLCIRVYLPSCKFYSLRFSQPEHPSILYLSVGVFCSSCLCTHLVVVESGQNLSTHTSLDASLYLHPWGYLGLVECPDRFIELRYCRYSWHLDSWSTH